MTIRPRGIYAPFVFNDQEENNMIYALFGISSLFAAIGFTMVAGPQLGAWFVLLAIYCIVRAG